jgi:cytoskeleton protein RodZ
MKIDNNESPEITVPLGKALKDARIVASLSIEEVAENLNLGVSTIRDLEDELDNILDTHKYPVIYLRGYLANYAKLVRLNTLELFVEYQQLEYTQKQKKTLPSPNLIIPRAKKGSKLLPFVFVIIIALGALFYIFQDQLFTATKLGDNTSELTSESEFKEDLARKLLIKSDVQGSEDESIEILENPGKNETIKSKEVEEEIKEEIKEDIKKVGLDVETQSEGQNIVIAYVDKINKSVAKEIETENIPHIKPEFEVLEDHESNIERHNKKVRQEFIAQSSPESLSLKFNAECWTEVFDATGERIAFGLYKNGRVLVLSGIAPFQLKLGDPSTVDIQYQEQIIKGEFTPGRSAQFSVPLS